MSLIKKIEKTITNDKLYFGIIIIIINILSKSISLELSPLQKKFFNNIYIRQILIFTIIFMGTKDLKTSFLLTGTFYVLASHLLHEDSRFSILPHDIKKSIDLNDDGVISNEEIQHAIKVLNKVKTNTSNDFHTLSTKQMLS